MEKEHYCDKEAVIATMLEQLTTIKEDVTEIKKDLKELPDKLEKRYATKEELSTAIKLVNTQTTQVKADVNVIKEWISKWGAIIIVVAYIVLGRIFNF